MKKYTTPNVEVTKFDVEDIMTTSGISLGSTATSAVKEAAKSDLKSAGYVAVEW